MKYACLGIANEVRAVRERIKVPLAVKLSTRYTALANFAHRLEEIGTDGLVVFNRFYQADRSLARQVGGCGLGLSIVKFVVEAHGGSVSVRSTPGEGSTFTVTLPARDSRVAGRLLEEAR